MIERKIGQLIKNDFNKGKAIVLMGARQVGKTSVVQALAIHGFLKK